MKENVISCQLNKNGRRIRHICSFIRRHRRLTEKQKNIITRHWLSIGIDFSENLLNLTEIFNQNAPITLEIGFGTGSSLVTMAKKAPKKNFLGVEVYMPGIRSCLSSAKKEGVNNLRIMYHDAVEVLQKNICDNSLNKVQIFFPDSWHKTRHHKRRIIQTPFCELIKKKLIFGGILHIATDWEPYAKHTLKVMSSIDGYKNQSVNNNYIPRPECRPMTKFEQRGLYFGHEIFDLMFQKIK